MPTFYLIELFSGTGSFGAAAKSEAQRKGYAFANLSVDIHPKYNPSTCVDIRAWDYKDAIDAFLPARPARADVVWIHASPPCNEYSFAKTSHVRDLALADSLVKRALKIIRFAVARSSPSAHFWTVENPVGLLHTRPFMQKLERFKNQTSYCKWGRPYRKNTHIWSNVPLDLPNCQPGSYCSPKASLGHHPFRAQKRDSQTAAGKDQPAQKVQHLYALPRPLVQHILRSAL